MPNLDNNLPTFKTTESLSRAADAKTLMLGKIYAPSLIIQATGAAYDLELDVSKTYVIILQNCGITNIKWSIDSTSQTDSFHGVMAACSVADDGLGGILTLPALSGKNRISLFSDGASKRVATWMMAL